MGVLEAGAKAAKVIVKINSGGQVRKADGGKNGVDRTGSNRHDNGWAADVALYNNGKILSSARESDLPIMITFMQACKDAGATAIGQGNNYMGNTGIHVDIALIGQSKGDIEIFGDGKQTRSFLFVDECVEGIVRLMKSDFSGPVNIGSDEMVTINQLVEIVASISNKEITINHIEGPLGVRGRNSDNNLIFEKLNWRPTQPLRDGLMKLNKWITELVITDDV